MTDAPPPSDRPPGWYPDPATQHGLRWWDGGQWTEQTMAAVEELRTRLEPVGEWLRQAVRLARSRAGHYFTLIVLLLVPISLVNAVVSWYAFREVVVLFDRELGTIDAINPGASVVTTVLVVVTTLALAVATLLMILATIHHARAVLAEEPEPWSDSLAGGWERLWSGVVAMAIALGILVGLLLVVIGIGQLAPAAGAVAVAAWLAAALIWGTRCSLIPVASLRSPPMMAVAESYRLTRSLVWPLIGRLAMLALVSFSLLLMADFVATPFVALGGGGSEPVELGAPVEEIPLAPFFGDNPATYAIGRLFRSIGIGAIVVLWSIGMLLIHDRLSGASGEPSTVPGPPSGTDPARP